MIEAANPRHEHEWQVWQDVKLPDDKILIPGVVSHCVHLVEHPELVAQRIVRFADVVGRERVIAGTDCGFGTSGAGDEVHPDVAWAKLARHGRGRADRIETAVLIEYQITPIVRRRSRPRWFQPELGVRVGTLVARGEAEIGVQQIGELLPIAGIDYIGPLPNELQTVIVYGVGAARQREGMAGGRGAGEVSSPRLRVAPILKRIGLDPA